MLSSSIENTHETPQSSRDEGLFLLYGLESNPESSLHEGGPGSLPLGGAMRSTGGARMKWPPRPGVLTPRHPPVASGTAGQDGAACRLCRPCKEKQVRSAKWKEGQNPKEHQH